jgi:regulator of RNase E activity RraA
VGSAVTLRYVPTRTSSGYSAANGHTAPLLGGRDIVTLSQTGDVLVIESNCQYAASAFGGIMATTVHEGGLAGIVVDGNIRDIGNLRKLGLPAWARGITPRTGKQRIELAELNGPVEISGVHIAPGDIVLGDADGIVIVPLHAAQEVLARAEKAVDTENSLIAALKKGATAQEVAGILSPDKW